MAVSETSFSTDENERGGCALRLAEDDTAAVRPPLLRFPIVISVPPAYPFPMRRVLFQLLCLLALVTAGSSFAATGKVKKVLPHFLDVQGRHTRSPSLFDRDAYQAQLRQHPDQRSGIRFDIEWKAKGVEQSPLKLRVELRGVARGDLPTQMSLETEVRPGKWFEDWTALTLKGDDYKRLGEVTAWRVTLWDGDRLLSEQKSFLWE